MIIYLNDEIVAHIQINEMVTGELHPCPPTSQTSISYFYSFGSVSKKTISIMQ